MDFVCLRVMTEDERYPAAPASMPDAPSGKSLPNRRAQGRILNHLLDQIMNFPEPPSGGIGTPAHGMDMLRQTFDVAPEKRMGKNLHQAP
ncbi:hypothetical protein OU682_12185 [Paracoccus sp. EF6]|uniref:Uncharacterized protein n=1 Tax=Paracoccus benzoatiresistens TaxID=2997341 RepID=A0ABT4J5H6_9RHOB|nr:hypothetical protein [Paracoccus sp. EF6]MCZ0962377.1 hypothetical protein [Paracoccus sp. EF6]